jgi:hypothetical protein
MTDKEIESSVHKVMYFGRAQGKTFENVRRIFESFVASRKPEMVVTFETPDTLDLKKQILALHARLKAAENDCKHPGCCCVCGHQGKCPEDGPSIISYEEASK